MNLVGGCSQTLSAASYNFLTCNLANVESLVISNDCGNCSGLWYLFDNFTYSGVSTTPEPGTLLMFGSGFLAVVGMIRRRFS